MFNPEVNELKNRYNILREQYQKLQGSIKVLQATTLELTGSLEKTERERDEFKKAFEEIFTNNIGDEWEHLPDEKKQEMSITEKIRFFEIEINSSKLYIRRQMSEQMKGITEENSKMKNEIVQLKARLEEKNKELDNARTVHGGPTNPHVENSLLDNNEMNVPAKSTFANMKGGENGNKPKPDILNAIRGKFEEMTSPNSTKSNRDNKGNAHNRLPKEEPIRSEDAPVPKEPEKKQPTPPPPSPQPQSKIPEPNNPEKTVEKIGEDLKGKETTSDERPTTHFFKRFEKAPIELQNRWKENISALDNILNTVKLGRECLLTIGSSGEYFVDDIFVEGIKRGYFQDSETEKNRVRRALSSMLGEDGKPSFLVKGNPGMPTGKGKPKICYLLSQAGEAWYALTTYKDPLKSLSIVRADEQKSVGHAELIQKMLRILNEHGYETYQEVAIKTKTVGEESIADISANKGNYNNLRIECEMGNYSTSRYIFKFRKALDVSDLLLVGVPTQVVKEKITGAIKELIREEYKGIDNFIKAGKYYKVFTVEELSKNPDLILPNKKNDERTW